VVCHAAKYGLEGQKGWKSIWPPKAAYKLNYLTHKLLIAKYLQLRRAAPWCAKLGFGGVSFFGRFCVARRTFPYS
jgi:hypothetical protein